MAQPVINGPWRLLVLDRSDGADPKWILCVVASPADVRPAAPADEAPDEVTARWVTARHGHPIVLAPVRASVWRVDRRP